MRKHSTRRPRGRSRLSAGCLLAVTVAMTVGACGSSGSKSSNSSTVSAGASTASATGPDLGTLKPGEVSIAYTNALMPYVGVDKQGKLTGADGDLFNDAAKQLGVTVKPNGMEFSALLAGVQSGRYDIGIGGISWTADRAKVGAMTDPVYYSPVVTISRPGTDIKTIDDLKGLKIGSLTGTINDKANRSVPGVTSHTYPSAPAAVADLVAGRIDSITLDPMTTFYLKKTRPDLKDYPVSAIESPTPADIKAHPAWTGFSKYMVVWYCSKQAKGLCDALNKEIDATYSSTISADTLKKWGVSDTQSFLTSDSQFAPQREAVDRPKGWVAPTLDSSAAG